MADVTNPTDTGTGGIIGWFARNHVAANLMMFSIIAFGLFAIFVQVKKEAFPQWNVPQFTIQVPYQGGTPEEVEEGVLIKIEETIRTIEGIGEIRSSAYENRGQVTVNVEPGYELDDVMNDAKLMVDTISSFPQETERPYFQKGSGHRRRNAIMVQVFGDMDEMSLKLFSETIRNEILRLPEVSYAEVVGTRQFEISIEISEDQLQMYDLTLHQVAQIIRRWSIDMSGGSIRSRAGNIRVRATGQAHTGTEYADITLLTHPDGTRLRLGDIATIRDDFAERQSYSFFDGKRSFGIQIDAQGNENAIAIAEAVRDYVQKRKATLPSSVSVEIWADTTYYLKGRLNLMIKNLGVGALLVILLLSLFLHMKVAAWVVVGLPVAFLGAFSLMPVVGVTINTTSLFAFILVIGIVVDDAIIIAESAYTETERNGYNIKSIVRGARAVALPASIGVLTTIAAFMPLLGLTSHFSTIASAIGWIIILCLIFSLVESKLILPSHLAIMKSAHGRKKGIAGHMNKVLKRFIKSVYVPAMRFTISYRYPTLVVFVSILIIAVGLVLGGIVRMVPTPEFESDYVRAVVTMKEATSESLLIDIVEQMNAALWKVNEELKEIHGDGKDVVAHLYTWTNRDGTRAQFLAERTQNDDINIPVSKIQALWRKHVGEFAGTEEISFPKNRWGGGSPISIALSSKNLETLDQASQDLISYLKSLDGVFNVYTSSNNGPEELKLRVKPEGEAVGLTLADLASQIRTAFYGAESQRIQRGESELRVMVRYPQDERQSIGNLENMWIRLPDGSRSPFNSIASYHFEQGYNRIRRVNGKRTAMIAANVDTNMTEPMRVIAQSKREFVPEMNAKYPGVSWGLYGSSAAERLGLHELAWRFLAALALVYILLAIPLRSYLQPLMIMGVVPFGIVGAIIGHLITGYAMSFVSFFGIVALSGIVVNDALILVHTINKRRQAGVAILDSILSAGATRLRPILLTSLTTFFGLAPILFERSVQAQIVIPMAVALAFGILFATLITLVLVPCLYKILTDIKREKDELVENQDTSSVDPLFELQHT